MTHDERLLMLLDDPTHELERLNENLERIDERGREVSYVQND